MTGSLPSYMKLNIMTHTTTSIHHTHDEDDTLAIYCSAGAAAGSSPEPDSDPKLIAETSGLKETRQRYLEDSPSGAGAERDLSIGAAGVATREDHAAGALRGVTAKGLVVPWVVTGVLEVGGTYGVKPTVGRGFLF
jgi:hypothetical protein